MPPFIAGGGVAGSAMDAGGLEDSRGLVLPPSVVVVRGAGEWPSCELAELSGGGGVGALPTLLLAPITREWGISLGGVGVMFSSGDSARSQAKSPWAVRSALPRILLKVALRIDISLFILSLWPLKRVKKWMKRAIFWFAAA